MSITRSQIRQELLEPLLAEGESSDFYTTTVQNYAINHQYRKFCYDTAAGPVASYAYSLANGDTVDGVNRYFNLPAELVRLWRVDYSGPTGTLNIEIPFMTFQQFSVRFGATWPNILSASMPLAYCVLGSNAIGCHPIPENGATLTVYGAIMPDVPASDGASLLILDADAYTVAVRAYLDLIERNAVRTGTPPPNYARAQEEAKTGTVNATERVRRMYGGIRSVGRFAPFTTDLSHRYWEPSFRWPG